MKKDTNKTAMQELIEKLDYSIQNSKGDYQMHFAWVKSHCIMLLEKEKEQIIDFGYKCRDNQKKLPQDIFNQTYNQNK